MEEGRQREVEMHREELLRRGRVGDRGLASWGHVLA